MLFDMLPYRASFERGKCALCVLPFTRREAGGPGCDRIPPCCKSIFGPFAAGEPAEFTVKRGD